MAKLPTLLSDPNQATNSQREEFSGLLAEFLEYVVHFVKVDFSDRASTQMMQ